VKRVKEPLEEVGPPMVLIPTEKQYKFIIRLLLDEIMTETTCGKQKSKSVF